VHVRAHVVVVLMVMPLAHGLRGRSQVILRCGLVLMLMIMLCIEQQGQQAEADA